MAERTWIAELEIVRKRYLQVEAPTEEQARRIIAGLDPGEIRDMGESQTRERLVSVTEYNAPPPYMADLPVEDDDQ